MEFDNQYFAESRLYKMNANTGFRLCGEIMRKTGGDRKVFVLKDHCPYFAEHVMSVLNSGNSRTEWDDIIRLDFKDEEDL